MRPYRDAGDRDVSNRAASNPVRRPGPTGFRRRQLAPPRWHLAELPGIAKFGRHR